jgi:hypothetical protein
MNNIVNRHSILRDFYHLQATSNLAQIYGVSALGNQAMVTSLPKVLGATGLALLLLLVTGCGKPDYPPNPKPTLHTTISADGQMVATLLNAGTDKQRLRVMRLDRDGGWQEISAPPLTQTIRFGLQGHQLLLTHHVQEQKQDRLVTLNLDESNSAPLTIYQADQLGFPQHISPKEYLVRQCSRARAEKGNLECKNIFEYRWVMVANGKQILQLGDREIPARYSLPTIVNRGVIWISEQIGVDDDPHPKIFAAALPDGQVPVFPRERLEKNTASIACDQAAQRCLRRFVSNLGQKGGVPFLYDVDVMFSEKRCKLIGVAGSSDGVSVTPDGLAGVMSLAAQYDKPRAVVVFRFAANSCEPISIRHINF